MASTGEAGVPARWHLVSAAAIPAAVALLVAALVRGHYFWQGDWPIVRPAADLLLAGDLRVYAQVPEAQMGPLALLLLGALPRPVLEVLVCALLGATLALVMLGQRRTRALMFCVLGGGLIAAFPWAALASTGHPDDALVALGAMGIVAGLRTRRNWLVGTAFVVALAGKPTAAVLLPLVWFASPATFAATVAAAGAVWAPFALADLHGFLAAGHGIARVWPGSVPDLLGGDVNSLYPDWIRPTQLIGGLALCWHVGRKVSPAAAVVAAVTFRALLEPGAFDSYSIGIIVAAVAADHELFRRPVIAPIAAVSFFVAHGGPMSPLDSAIRTATLVVALVLAARPPAPEPSKARTPDVALQST